MNFNLKELSDKNLISLYSDVTKELKNKGIVRTKNILGDLGETLAIRHYCDNPNYPNLIDEKTGAKNIDARDSSNNTYSIKSTSTKTTGVFRGLPHKDSKEEGPKLFDYAVICKFDDNLSLEAIYQLTWEKFRENKHWQSRVQAWYLIINRKLIQDSVIVFSRERQE